MAGLLLLALLTGCGGGYVAPKPSPDVARPNPIGAQQALDRLRGAIDTHSASGLQGLEADIARNARALRVAGFTARYITEDDGVGAGGSWTADVDITWCFAGFDRSLVRQTVSATFAPAGGGIRITSFGGTDHRVPTWLTGPVSVRRTADTLVLVAGGEREADQYARLATNAVTTVRRVLPWPDPRLVFDVPSSEAALESALGANPGDYAGVAAVTASVDGSNAADAPVHVFVNPDAIGKLNQQGAQVVLSHEATHVATGVALGSPLPEWLLEGFADYVALRDVPLPLSTTAGQVLRDVRRNGAPDHLPGTAEFNEHAEDFGEEYEAAWLANRLLAELGGEQRLVRLYDEVNAGAPLDPTMRRLFGFGVEAFTRKWQEHLTHLAS